ncbi:hypothetical protein P691DRAFT_574737 [Macrolepiota fuliginosa MF-IS2]|uniref:Uncharacterized protein n=1 Tax=Macrolepiota fuliginosa MF-IS2 TaxID=1400762 RepID=A0A9P5XEF5_9AGAR|nr:hypothetical protein P691DRAFT_574737 [Macrolepiota fuliginosa MF-IS2]
MVHRLSDSRLLSNLISHEKDYSKHLQSLLSSSHASLASLSAFAAAATPSISRVILSISGDLSSADDALRRYKDAVDAWREQLKTLKDMEAEISNILRDREILVTRVLKASKSEKLPKDKDRNGNVSRRNSVISQHQRFPSSSSLSLSVDHSAYTPSASLPTSSKLANAQTELQACEAHLAVKERELEVARVASIRDGLHIRCDALVECGRDWVEMGKVALRTLEGLQVAEGDLQKLKHPQEPYSAPHPPSSTLHKALLPPPRGETGSDLGYHPSSELSSIGPSQSASQVNISIDTSATVIPNAPNPILGFNGSDIQSGQTRANPMSAPHVYKSDAPPSTLPPSNVEYGKFHVPPAHAILDTTMPTVTPITSRLEAPRTGSGYLTPASNEEEKPYTTTERRTTNHTVRVDKDLDAEDQPYLTREEKLLREGKLRIVDNPRYHQPATVPEAPISQPGTVPTHAVQAEATEDSTATGPAQVQPPEPEVADNREIGEREELSEQTHGETPPSISEQPQTPKKRSKRMESPAPGTPQKSGFLGSLKKVFGHHRDTSVERGEKAREKERGKEEKAVEREEKAKEKEQKREERVKQQKERKEKMKEREAEDKERASLKKKQKRERQMKSLVPDSSDDEGGDVSDEEKRTAGRASGFLKFGKKKKQDKWETRTDKNLSEIRGQSGEGGGDRVVGVMGGFVMKENVDLEKNLREGVAGRRASIGGVDGGKQVKGSVRRASTDGRFVVEGGAKVGRTVSLPPVASSSRLRPEDKASRPFDATSGRFVYPPPPVPSHPGASTETRFREELASQSGSSSRISPTHKRESGGMKDKGYASDTTSFASARAAHIPTASAPTGPTGVARKPTTKKRTSAQVGGSGHGPVLNGAPVLGGPSSGYSGRRASVDINAAPPRPASGAGHRRVASVDYGRPTSTTFVRHPPTRAPATIMIPAVPSAVPPTGGQDSLMSIVDSVTRRNRQAWDAALMEARVDKSRGEMKSEIASSFSGRNGSGVVMAAGTGTGEMVEGRATECLGDSVRAPLSTDREVLLTSTKGTPGLPRGGATTAFMTVRTQVNGVQDKKPLKSAMRASRSPSPERAVRDYVFVEGSGVGRGSSRAYATGTGRDRIVPMEVLPSVSSLPGETRTMPGGGVTNGKKKDEIEDEEDDDSASISSYETGQENIASTDDEKKRKTDGAAAVVRALREEDVDRRPGGLSLPVQHPGGGRVSVFRCNRHSRLRPLPLRTRWTKKGGPPMCSEISLRLLQSWQQISHSIKPHHLFCRCRRGMVRGGPRRKIYGTTRVMMMWSIRGRRIY